jgi:hypothetical protein
MLTYDIFIICLFDSPDYGTCLYIADSTDPLTYTVVALNIFLRTFYLKRVTDRGRNML